MPLLIDGYNLLHVTGLFGRGGRGSFEASRAALLGFLAAALEPADRAHTTVVFDAAEAPPGLPDHYVVHGIAVVYAREYESADELLEILIAGDHAPRKLTVVSSDHRVQRAAKKRRAQAVDSHVWYHAAAERLNKRKRGIDLPDIKPEVPLTPGEVEVWLRAFGPIDISDDLLADAPPAESTAAPPPRTKKKAVPKRAAPDVPPPAPRKAPRVKKPQATRPKKRSKPKNLGFGDIANPFPPGYGEDILRDDEKS